jgi:hemolysin D
MKSAESSALSPIRRLPPARRGAELQFLPAALEIMETPASPVGRAIGGVIILFFAAALAWACLGSVDIIATARGKIVPSGRSKVIQPFETGVVRAIHVRDGEAVKAGEVLIELDPTIDYAARDKLATQLRAAALDAARLRAALADDPAAAFQPPAGAPAAEINVQRMLLFNQVEEHRSKLAELDRQIAESAANRNAVAAMVRKLALALPLLRQRAEARRKLADLKVGSRLQYLEIEQDRVEHEEELHVQQARLVEADAALASLEERRRQADAEYHRTNLGDLAQAEEKASTLRQELIAARRQAALETLTSPVDGTVQQLAVHTVGGVVTPAQPLMVVVPADSRLEIEAMVSNRDVGFVHVGQPAEIKIDTFNFTRYGLLHGEVLNVSQDAISRPQGKPNTDAGAEALEDNADAGGQQLVYAARISLDRPRMRIEDRLVSLSPGMAVTVEIKTGSRRVIEYLLSPLLRYRQTALRER